MVIHGVTRPRTHDWSTETAGGLPGVGSLPCHLALMAALRHLPRALAGSRTDELQRVVSSGAP